MSSIGLSAFADILVCTRVVKMLSDSTCPPYMPKKHGNKDKGPKEKPLSLGLRVSV